MSRRIAENSTRREFLKQAAVGGAVALMSPASRVLGANDRVRVGMIGAGPRGQELLHQVLGLPNAQAVAIPPPYSRRPQAPVPLVPPFTPPADHPPLRHHQDI